MMLLLSMAFAFSPWEATKVVRTRDGGVIHAPTLVERATLDGLVRRLVREAPSGTLSPGVVSQASKLGMTLRQDDGMAVLTGRPGWMLLAIRLGPASPWILQAPHPWYDLGTGDLVDKLFEESTARAVVFSTAHRNLGPHTDVAHFAEGSFHTATLALAAGIEEPIVVQIHGFGGGHTAAEVVIGGWGATPLARSLARTMSWEVATGEEVPELAGQMNLQVRALEGQVPVAHLELSRAARKLLRRDGEARARFWSALRGWSR